MYYVYVLKCNSKQKIYVGFSTDLKSRIKSHILGKVISTAKRRPIKLIYYECFENKIDAINREKYLKSGYGRQQLEEVLKNTLL